MRFAKLFKFFKKGKNKRKWKTDIKGKEWNKVSLEKAKFIFEQSQLSLESTINSRNRIKDTAFKMLNYNFLILLGLVGYFFSKYNFYKSFYCQDLKFIIPIIIYVLATFGLIWFLIDILTHNSFYGKGNSPCNLLIKKIADKSYKNLLIGEILTYQSRIDSNKRVNNKVAKKVNYIMITMIILPLALLFIVFIFTSFTIST
jgi:hypothetical protein